MIANYNMVVDFARPSKSNTILVAENDANSRNCNFKLLFDKAPFDMTGVVSASVLGITASGARIYGDAEIKRDEEGNIINELSYLIPLSITENAGNVTMTVTLTDEVGARITSFEFYIKVRNALYDEDDFIDDDDMSGFRDLLARTRAALERMEQMVQEDALPNPYPIRITVDDVEYEYNGEDLVEIFMGKVAYYGEPSGLVDVTEDDSAAAVAVRAAEEAEGYAEDAEAKYNEMLDVYNDLQGIIPTARVERDSETHVARVIITDRSGETSVDLADGAPGPQGDPGEPGSKGDRGETGVTPSITASASVNNTTGTPSVTVTKSGTDENPTLAFAFENLKGEAGVPGPKGDKGDRGESGASEWGGITGSIEDQTDLANALASKADASDVSELVPEVLLKDTVGWTGKNLLPNNATSQTINGVTFIVKSDGTITLSGTASANTFMSISDWLDLPSGKYTLNGSASNKVYVFAQKQTSGGAETVAECRVAYPNGVSFDWDNSAKIRGRMVIENGQNVDNITIYPMLRKADISDSTYEPYHPSVEQTLRDAEVIEGKNLLHIPDSVVTQTINGVTFTVNRNSDGEVASVVANGTASANTSFYFYYAKIWDIKSAVLWSVLSQAGSDSSYRGQIYDRTTTQSYLDYGNGVEIPQSVNGHNMDIYIRIASGYVCDNVVFKPMLCTEEEWNKSHDFEPYYIPLKDSKFDRAEQRVLGAKNFFKYDRVPASANGITVTQNVDGSITLSGTASTNTYIQLTDMHIEGTYIASGCPDGGSAETYELQYIRRNAASTADEQVYKDYGDGVKIESVSSKILRVIAVVRNGVTINLTFYPMLRLASDPDDTYVPYAKTNREITEELAVQESAVTNIVSGATIDTLGTRLRKVGRLVEFALRLNDVTANAYATIGLVPEGYRPSGTVYVASKIAGEDALYMSQVDGNGVIQFPKNLTSKGIIIGRVTWITS